MGAALARPEKLALGLHSAGMLMTPKEFDAVDDYDEDYQYELIHGVLVVSAVPLPQERGPNDLLGHWLLAYQEEHPQGAALDYTLPQHYIRTADSRRIADRAIWAGLGRLPRFRRDPPTMAVEFVSAGRRNRERDYRDKRREYKEAGVIDYWIIDRFERTMTVVHLQKKRQPAQVISEKETYRPPLLPGFELPLARLLQAADRAAKMLAEGEADRDEP